MVEGAGLMIGIMVVIYYVATIDMFIYFLMRDLWMDGLATVCRKVQLQLI